MSRCRELSGVLFKHACSGEAETQCISCQKPVCALHHRPSAYGPVCVGCLRAQLRNPSMQGSYAHLRDDPYFYWYYRPDNWMSDPYGAEDYALFDNPDNPDFGSGVDDSWTGS